MEVRERSLASVAHRDHRDRAKRPAHPSNRLVTQLSETWRVVDDPLQWKLQRKKGNPRNKNSGWRDRSFCTTRDVLLRCIREYCCSPDEGESRCIHEYRDVEEAALQRVRELPEWHIDWKYTVAPNTDPTPLPTLAALPPHHGMPNLDVHGTEQDQADAALESLISCACGSSGGEEWAPSRQHVALY